MKKIKNVMITADDGTKLGTDLWLPEDSGSFPVLINRTPYNKDDIHMDVPGELEDYIAAGYALVVQDVRGRYSSEGTFEPYAYEIEDGAALFRWVKEQSWCNGKIGTFGRSYHGGTQWLLALTNPPGLKAMVPVVTFDDLFDGCMYQNGAKVLHDLRWTVASIIPDVMNRARAAGEEVSLPVPEVYNCLEQIPIAADPAVRKYGSYYIEWLEHDTNDHFWKRFSPRLNYEKMTAPALNISGWYDIFAVSTTRNYMGLRRHGGSSAVRGKTRLIMGPWTHTNFTGRMNGVDYGSCADAAVMGLTKIKIAWYDHWLKDMPDPYDDGNPVLVFVMGENRWEKEQDWPVPGTDYISLSLHSDGHAGQTNGLLSAELPEREEFDTFIYDPLNPVPTTGGAVILPGEGAMGPRDQQEVEKREDVLVFETKELDRDLKVIGQVTAKLFVSSDCPDTDFTVKLTDVFPDGTSMLLTDGILRMRYRNSLENTSLMEPGKIYAVNINAGVTANVFRKGHRIRVSISSSNFPRFNRNSNSGGKTAFEKISSYRKARNTVYHDGAHPSCLILPVIR